MNKNTITQHIHHPIISDMMIQVYCVYVKQIKFHFKSYQPQLHAQEKKCLKWCDHSDNMLLLTPKNFSKYTLDNRIVG